MQSIKMVVRHAPLIGPLLVRAKHSLERRLFPGSRHYWEKRYATGGNSGPGSYGKLGEFKAEVLNQFVRENGIQSVVEFGCGDGHQLSLATYPSYVGLDVSPSAIARCRQRFQGDPTKRFVLYEPVGFDQQPDPSISANLALSLDVIYHLIEDSVFELYMKHLFACAQRYVIIYSSDTDYNRLTQTKHVRHRNFSRYVDYQFPDWVLKERLPHRFPYEGNADTGSRSEFFMYTKRAYTLNLKDA